MASGTRTCDICGKPVEKFAAKLYFAPKTPRNISRMSMNDYTAHLDVGTCCLAVVNRFGRWRKRQKKEEKQSQEAAA